MPLTRSAPLNATVLAYDALCTFEFGIAVEVFGLPRPELGDSWYRFSVAAAEPGPLRGPGGVQVMADGDLGLLGRADLIVIPGWKALDAPIPEELIDHLLQAADRGARFLTICTGVFVLAQAGLLNGKRATTHWRYCDALTRRFPDVQVEPHVLYVDSGNVVTSAGSAAGIDAALHIVRRDYGAQTANHVARRLVVPPHRDGGQAQYVDRPIPRDRDHSTLAATFDYMREHLHETLPLDELAGQARMSKRTFLRRFRETTGVSAGEWLTIERLARAKELLETTGFGVDAVAEKSGFGSGATLRHHFRERLDTTPTNYRRMFMRRPVADHGAISGRCVPGRCDHAPA